jgi:outer membrane protein assembly factor BamB
VTAGTQVVAIDLTTRAVLWATELAKIDYSKPAVANGLVYVGTVGTSPSFHGAIYALDATTGAVVWLKQLNVWIDGSPVVVDGKLLVTAGDGLHVFAPSSVRDLPGCDTATVQRGRCG